MSLFVPYFDRLEALGEMGPTWWRDLRLGGRAYAHLSLYVRYHPKAD